MHSKNCPSCGELIKYKTKGHLNWSIKYGFRCSKSCFGPIKKGYKICSGCKKEKCLKEFGSLLGKLNPRCKECQRKRIKKWRKENPKKQKAAEIRQRNKPKTKIYKKKWTNKNRRKLNAKSKIYTRKRRAKIKNVKQNYTLRHEQITLEVFGNNCFKCGSNKKLAIDHHCPLNKGNALTITNAVPLCGSCNSKKGTKDPEKFYTKLELQKINKLFKKAKVLLGRKA